MALPRSSHRRLLAALPGPPAARRPGMAHAEPEQTGGSPVAKNTMQPGTHVDSITGESRWHVGPWYQLVHNNSDVLFILLCAGATLKRGKGAAFIG